MTIPTAEKRAKTRARKFYLMGPDITKGGGAGFEVQNLAALLCGRRVLGPPVGERGFADFDEPPRVLIAGSLGRPPRDLEMYHEYWLVSDRLKQVLEAVDPAGIACVKCAVRNCDGTDRPDYWLCDVLRVLDAVDEGASRVKISRRDYEGRPWKGYSLLGGASLIFRGDVVRAAHIFRLQFLTPQIICDQELRDACKKSGLKGIRFRDAANYLGY
ncbi:imm11 family protein [Bradyrhizobium septentrionale]|uniref:DUF1629 domain-containing protein n=1 Tax=Bradyrhizobium septentrionale TaxID=1404411 RepID=A0A973W5Z4_9BRAD|nr:DUF1629 domain-containing protein [Bradyrhizobium septentrionale]UGY16546.1 DUF1629 domain-containing protein [Bradyrhizobium septentrionale]UGY25203.1 DUF1629 domain-containing protein [Bradyrhizobium septentrionale]